MTSPRRIALAGLLFLLVFGWKIGFYLDLILVASVACIVWAHLVGVDRLPRPMLDVTLLLGAIALYSLGVTFATGGQDPFYFLRAVRVLINFLGATFLVQLLRREYGDAWITAVLVQLYVAIGLHGVLIGAMFLAPTLRESVYAIVGTHTFVNDTMPFRAGLRIPGLTYGLAMTSVVQMSALVLFPWVLLSVQRIGARILLVALVPVLVVSVLLTGRTGLALGLALVPLSALLAARSGGGARFGVRHLLVAGAVTFGVVLLGIRLGPDDFSDYNLTVTREVWELFGSADESATVNNLRAMWFAPDSAAGIVFGTGSSGRGALGVIPSDIGYVLVLHGLGLLGSIIFLSVPLTMFVVALVRRKAVAGLAHVVMLLTFTGLAVHAKEIALMTRNGWTIETMVFACLVLATEPLGRADVAIRSFRPEASGGPAGAASPSGPST